MIVWPAGGSIEYDEIFRIMGRGLFFSVFPPAAIQISSDDSDPRHMIWSKFTWGQTNQNKNKTPAPNECKERYDQWQWAVFVFYCFILLL